MNPIDRLTAALTALLLVLACTPVSDEARLQITGTIANPDGSPAANQEVELYKTDLPLLDSDWWLAASIEGITPFRTVRTDDDGYFEFSLAGSDANTAGQGFAAYFAVVATQGDDRSLAVASRQFQFSNNDLYEDFPQMRFWDASTATVADDSVQIAWTDRSGSVQVALPNGVWLEDSSNSSLEIPLTALRPAQREHDYVLFSVDGDLRYRTSVRSFAARNPLGAGYDYRDPESNTSAKDCAGGNVFDLVDGIYAGAQGQGSHLFADDTGGEHCIVIDLQGSQTVDHISVHNANIIGLEEATVEISSREGDGEWTLIDSHTGRISGFDSYYRDLAELNLAASELRIEVVSQTDARFLELGEVVVHIAE